MRDKINGIRMTQIAKQQELTYGTTNGDSKESKEVYHTINEEMLISNHESNEDNHYDVIRDVNRNEDQSSESSCENGYIHPIPDNIHTIDQRKTTKFVRKGKTYLKFNDKTSDYLCIPKRSSDSQEDIYKLNHAFDSSCQRPFSTVPNVLVDRRQWSSNTSNSPDFSDSIKYFSSGDSCTIFPKTLTDSLKTSTFTIGSVLPSGTTSRGPRFRYLTYANSGVCTDNCSPLPISKKKLLYTVKKGAREKVPKSMQTSQRCDNPTPHTWRDDIFGKSPPMTSQNYRQYLLSRSCRDKNTNNDECASNKNVDTDQQAIISTFHDTISLTSENRKDINKSVYVLGRAAVATILPDRKYETEQHDATGATNVWDARSIEKRNSYEDSVYVLGRVPSVLAKKSTNIVEAATSDKKTLTKTVNMC